MSSRLRMVLVALSVLALIGASISFAQTASAETAVAEYVTTYKKVITVPGWLQARECYFLVPTSFVVSHKTEDGHLDLGEDYRFDDHGEGGTLKNGSELIVDGKSYTAFFAAATPAEIAISSSDEFQNLKILVVELSGGHRAFVGNAQCGEYDYITTKIDSGGRPSIFPSH